MNEFVSRIPYMKESLYYAKLNNGLTVTLLPKTDFNEAYGVLTTEFGLYIELKGDGRMVLLSRRDCPFFGA